MLFFYFVTCGLQSFANQSIFLIFIYLAILGWLSIYYTVYLHAVYTAKCVSVCHKYIQLQSATKIRRSRLRRAYTDAASETLTPSTAAGQVLATSAVVPPVSITVRVPHINELPSLFSFLELSFFFYFSSSFIIWFSYFLRTHRTTKLHLDLDPSPLTYTFFFFLLKKKIAIPFSFFIVKEK